MDTHRIDFKLLLITFNALHGLAPMYILNHTDLLAHLDLQSWPNVLGYYDIFQQIVLFLSLVLVSMNDSQLALVACL